MELSLEVNLIDNSISLIDRSLCSHNMPLITISDICAISDHFSGNPMFRDIILDLTENQIIVTLYFLLHRTIFPPPIISGYLYDVGICTDKADRLGRLIYDLKSEILDQDEFDYKKFIRNESFNMSTRTDRALNGKLYDLSSLFNSLDPNLDYYYCYDSVACNTLTVKRCLDLSHVKETLFEVEDKKQIIMGLSVSYTSFLRNIASENRQLLYELSRIVAIGYRDKTSLGSALIDHQEILTILLNFGFKSFEYFGSTEGGNLIHIQEGIYRKRELIAGEQPICIPLFVKIWK